MLLTDACEREDLEVLTVDTDYRHKRHLENLSIIKGAILTCLYNRSGDVVIKVRDGRIAINREFASQISVKSLNPEDYVTKTNASGKNERVPTAAALIRFRKEDDIYRQDEKVFREALKKQREEEKKASEVNHV
jgi:Fe2+ transport system protein FeoA